MDYIPHLQPQDHLARTLFERHDDAAPTIQQWMTVEYPDGQNIRMRKDGATRSGCGRRTATDGPYWTS
eukprot:6186969-Prorocentrum_lima.AAC.1